MEQKKDLIRSKTKTPMIDEKYMTMKYNSDDDLPLNKTLELHSMIIVIWSVFH